MAPGVSPAFYERVQQVADGVAMDENARMLGQNKQEQNPVSLEEAIWNQMRSLAGAA